MNVSSDGVLSRRVVLRAGHIPCADPEARSIAELCIHTDREGVEVLVVGVVDPLVPGGQQLGSIGRGILYAFRS
jgi:hypothetical protein